MAGRLVVGPGGEVNSTDHVEEVGLYGQLADIRQALAAGQKPADGALLGLPELDGDVWADIAGAAAISGAAPKTITGWLSRGGPKHCPFPAAHRFLYRSRGGLALPLWERRVMARSPATFQRQRLDPAQPRTHRINNAAPRPVTSRR